MATLLLRDEVHPDDLRATSADTSWELGVSELDHLTYLAPIAVLLAEWPGDVNRCLNPSFEDGLNGWTKQLEGGSTVEADYSEGYDDGRSARMTRGTGICWLFEASTRPVDEGWQTVFLRVKGTPGARFVGRLHNYSGGAGSVYGPTLVLDGTWQVYTFSQYREAGSYRLILHLETDGATCNVDTVSVRYAPPVVDPVDSRWAQVDVAKADTLSLVAGQQGGRARKRILSTANGLLGEYFSIVGVPGPPPQYFGSLVFTRVDPVVDFNWGTSGPGNGLGVDYFAVRWSGYVLTKAAGTYTFATITDDGTRVWVNGALVIDKWQQQSPTRWAGSINLPANALVPIVFEFYEWTGGATARLFWTPPGESEAIIPTDNLFTGGVEEIRVTEARKALATVKEAESQGMLDSWAQAWAAERSVTETLAGSDTRYTKPGKKAIEAQAVAESWARILSAFRTFPEISAPTDSRKVKATALLPQESVAPGDVRRLMTKRPAGGEVITLTDAYSDAWSALRILGETQLGTDARWVSAKPRWSEAAGLSDNRSARTGKWASEVEPLAEVLNRAWAAVRTFAETHSPVETLRSRFSTHFAEIQAVSESWARTWSAFLTVAQAVSPADMVRKFVRRTLADLQVATEALASLWTAFLRPGEVLTPADTQRMEVGTLKAEALGPQDIRWAKAGKKVTDAQGLLESWSKAWQALRQIPDSLGAVDALRKTGKSGLSEGLAALDARTVKPGKKASDAVSLVSQLATVWTAFAGLFEALVPGDVRKAKTTRPAQETLGAGDARTVRATKTGTDMVLPQVDLASFWQAYVDALESVLAFDAQWTLARLRKSEATTLGTSLGSVFSARRLLSEATGVVDNLAHRFGRIAGDMMQALDALWARIRALRSENATADGTLSNRVVKPLGDVAVPAVARWSQAMARLASDVAASDAFTRAWSAFLTATESAGLSTALWFATLLRRSETLVADAVQTLRVAFTVAEGMALEALLSWRAWMSWVLTETLAVLDAFRAWVASLRSEAQATVDGLAKRVARAFSDVLTGSGWFAAKARLAWTSSVALADGLWKKASLKKAEASTVADLRAVVVRQYLTVIQELADAYDHAAQFVRVLSDQAGLTEVARWVAKLLRPEQATAAVDARGLVRALKTDALAAVVLRYGRAVKSVAESLTFTDWIRSQTAKLTTDFAVLFATATQQVGLWLGEARVLGADAWSAVTKLVTEASVTADTIARRWAITRVWSVAVSLADVRKLKVSKPVQDVLAILDVLGRAWQAVRSWTDVAALNLLARMRSSKLVQESVTVWQLLRALVMLRKLDTTSPGDELRKHTAHPASDELKAVADQAVRTGKALNDLLTPSVMRQFTLRARWADATILGVNRRMFVAHPLPFEIQESLDEVLKAAGKSLADAQASKAGIVGKTIGAVKDEAVRIWDWWARRWRAVRSMGDLVVMSDVRMMLYRRLAKDVAGLTDGIAKTVGKAIQLVQSISEWFRQRFLGIYRRYNIRTLPWDATVKEQPWALAVQEIDSQPRVVTTAWLAQARQIGWAQVREVGPRVLEMLVGEKRNVQLLVEAADGQPIQVDSQPPVVIEYLDGNQVKQDFGWVETGNKVFYGFAPEQPGQYVLEFTISVDNGRQVLKHRVSVHVKS